MEACRGLRTLLEGGPGENPDDTCVLMWRLLEGVLTNTNDMIYAHDANGVLFFINASGLEMLKYTPAEMRPGLSIYQFVVPDYVDLVERVSNPPARPSGLPIPSRSTPATAPAFRLKSIPTLFDDNGDMIAVVGVARSLVLERRLQEAISRANMNLENLFEIRPFGGLLANPDGCINNANQMAASLLGARDPNAVIGSSAIDLWGGEDSEAAEALREALAKGRELHQRFIGKTSHGTPLKCDILAQPLGEGAKAQGQLILIIDISEQLELQRSLLQSEKLYTLGELVLGVAHN